jgi:hypothetical protein
MALSLVILGCDTNPNGPSAPSRTPAPAELNAAEPVKAVPIAKKGIRGKAKKKPLQQPDRTATFE